MTTRTFTPNWKHFSIYYYNLIFYPIKNVLAHVFFWPLWILKFWQSINNNDKYLSFAISMILINVFCVFGLIFFIDLKLFGLFLFVVIISWNADRNRDYLIYEYLEMRKGIRIRWYEGDFRFDCKRDGMKVWGWIINNKRMEKWG